MNTKFLNFILIGAIAIVAVVLGFFAWQLFSGGKISLPFFTEEKSEVKIFPEVSPIKNEGKVSEDRDAALELDVRAMHDAVVAYANDHDGVYPESDIKSPCMGVRYCLKGVDINTKEKIYLSPIPQVQPSLFDYYYFADPQKESFCIRPPTALETDPGRYFQCSENGCGRVSIADGCRQ